MFKRLKNLWALSGYKVEDSTTLAEIDTAMGRDFAPRMSHNLVRDLPLGDGKAEFLGNDMTEEEFYDYMRDEENGWSNLKNRLFKRN